MQRVTVLTWTWSEVTARGLIVRTRALGAVVLRSGICARARACPRAQFTRRAARAPRAPGRPRAVNCRPSNRQGQGFFLTPSLPQPVHFLR